ncbi:hypothetical protein KUV74_18360 [Halomonas sp. DP1Y21-3]|uniref:hypothetical protein n=1 Tax=Halomonas sp. DP1Y21-3 TaxID=2859080 RepID=UPI001C964F34|nr:hypothetical protein [Halomonas sp. DP1Y21-3]MBY6112364.1 hypothetical protein [Halomonas sp. DP1Y21-3]
MRKVLIVIKPVLAGLEKILYLVCSFAGISIIFGNYNEEEIADFFYLLSFMGALGFFYNLGVSVRVNKEIVSENYDVNLWGGYFTVQLVMVVLVSIVLVLVAEYSEIPILIAIVVSIITLLRRVEIFQYALLNRGKVMWVACSSVVGRAVFILLLASLVYFDFSFYYAHLFESMIFFIMVLLVFMQVFGKIDSRVFYIREAVGLILSDKKLLLATALSSIFMYIDVVIAKQFLTDEQFTYYIGAVRVVLPVAAIGAVMSAVSSKFFYNFFLDNKNKCLLLIVSMFFSSLVVMLLLEDFINLFFSMLFKEKWYGVSSSFSIVKYAALFIFWGQFFSKLVFLNNRAGSEALKLIVGVALYTLLLPFLANEFGLLGASVSFLVVYIFVDFIFPIGILLNVDSNSSNL